MKKAILILVGAVICSTIANAATLTFSGKDLHRDMKLEIFLNGSRMGVLASQACLRVDLGSVTHLTITSQAYNQIDAKQGPLAQYEMDIDPFQEYHLSGSYKPGAHFVPTEVTDQCASPIDRDVPVPALTKDCPKKIHFYGAQLQTDLKIKLEINGVTYPYFVSKGTDLVFCTSSTSLKIITQAYNQIDAIAGPPFQLELNDIAGENFIAVRYSNEGHLTVSDQAEFDKSAKKIKSTVTIDLAE